MNNFEKLIQENIVKIELLCNNQIDSVSTGFFISKNIILTCRHAVDDNIENINIYWNKNKILVESIFFLESDIDLALIIVNSNNKSSVYIDKDIRLSDKCYSYGFTKEYIDDGIPLTFIYEGQNNNLLSFKEGNFQPGFSGSPIINLRTKSVCGIIHKTRDENSSLGGRGISIDKIYYFEMLNNEKNIINNEIYIQHWLEVTNNFKYMVKQKYKKEYEKISYFFNNSHDNTFVDVNIVEKYLNNNDKNLINEQNDLNNQNSSLSDFLNKISGIDSIKFLFYGKAGIGKSTISKYIAYQWAIGNIFTNFDYLIFISLRKWRNLGIDGAIQDNFNMTNNFKYDNTLFILDGYDELDTNKKIELKDELQRIKNYIITTRPYAFQPNEFDIQQQFELNGFSIKGIYEYITNFFNYEFDERPIEEWVNFSITAGKILYNSKANNLKEYIYKNTNLIEISKIPLLLEMICIFWQHNSENIYSKVDTTISDLYRLSIEYILNDFAEYKDQEKVYQKSIRRKIIYYLSKIAYEAFLKNKIILDDIFLEQILDEIDKDNGLEFFEKHVIHSGFLKTNGTRKSIADNDFEFIHLTFQEYFAALYIERYSKISLIDIFTKYKFDSSKQLFLTFLEGLCNKNNKTLVMRNEEKIDIIGLYQLILKLKLSTEINIENSEKYLIDITKELSEWYSILIYLNMHNNLLDKIVFSSNRIIYKHFINYLFSLLKYENIDNNFLQNIISKIGIFARDDMEIDNIIYFNKKKLDEKLISKLEIALVRDKPNTHITLDDIISIGGKRDYSDDLIDGFVDMLNDNSFDDMGIGFKINKLAFLSKIDSSKYPYILEKYTDLKDNELFYVFIENANLNFNTIFKAYDNGYNVFDCIFYHSIYSLKPIYIKNDKLTTIEDGIEISTKSNIDINTFNKNVQREKRRIKEKIFNKS